ncbi:MAG: MFS transporter, partial [Phycisphaerae bacterium]|nr:MFS transporter [Phycisphaerae bacterium]
MMRHWSGLATRNWHAKQVRSGGAVAAIALGVAAVVWVTCCYESVRASVMEWATGYIGAAQITVQSPLGKYDTVPARLVDAIAQVEGVAQVNGTLVQRLRVAPVSAAERGTRSADTLRWSESLPEVDLRGIDLRTELAFRQPRVSAGRMLSEEDEYEIVLDSGFAEDFGLALGDSLFVWGASQERAFELRIVGLMRVRRVGRFQKGQALMPLATLQRINSKTGQVTAVDVRLTEATPDAVALAQSAIRSVALRILPNAVVRSVEGRMRQIQFAQRQQEFVLMVASCVVMLTALVTILSTLSMGMIERISQLGLMRCVGLTGGQLSCLMLLEVLPLGLVGILTGLPLGLAMTGVTVWLVPEYVGQFVINPRGLLLATGAGLATTLTAALLPMIAALTVSPMEAAHPRARPAPAWVLLLVFVLATIALPGQMDLPLIPDAPLFGLDPAAYEPSRIVAPLCAIWLIVFSIPLFLYTPDLTTTGERFGDAMRHGVGNVIRTISKLRDYRNVALFLVARMLYADGKTAILIFSGIYAAGVMQWGLIEM